MEDESQIGQEAPSELEELLAELAEDLMNWDCGHVLVERDESL